MRESGRSTVTLVLGGVRSGKSRWAQELAQKAGHVAYFATAQALDDEMSQKIRRHQEDRPGHWKTVEEPLELAQALSANAAGHDILLVDCLTLFVSNLLHAEESAPGSMAERIESLMEVLRHPPASIVLVSNEVGSGVVPVYALGRQFRDALGELNQRIAAVADDVVLLVAGLPLALKGSCGARP